MTYPKQGHIECRPYLTFCRSLPCFQCNAPAPSQAHHHPPKGRGVLDDTKTVPVCVLCHQRCHGITVKVPDRDMRLFPIPEAEQSVAVDRVLRMFLRDAPMEAFEAYGAVMTEWRSRRPQQSPCPF